MSKCVICGNKRITIEMYPIGNVCLNCRRLMRKEMQKINYEKNNYFLAGITGQLYVYENKIEIKRKGIRALLAHGLKGTKTIPISSIKGIQFKLAGITRGYIQFTVEGSFEGKRGLSEAIKDENTVDFCIIDNKKAKDIKDYIENLILNETNQQTTMVLSTSNADEIKKYKELLDMGAITQEEFECKKKQILDL